MSGSLKLVNVSALGAPTDERDDVSAQSSYRSRSGIANIKFSPRSGISR